MQKSKISIFEILIAIYYTWFFMPIVNAYFSANIYKYVFFAMFAVGMFGLLFLKARILSVAFNRMLVAILAYFVAMTVMYVLDVKDASEHIRVSFTFWGTSLVYFYALDDSGKTSLGKYFLAMFLVTCITSSLGVLIDNSAARTITHAAANDAVQHSYKMKNIAGIYLFQGMVLCVPSLIAISKCAKTKIACVVTLIFLLVILINASFTISLLMFFISLILCFVLSKSQTLNKKFLKIVVSVAMLVALIFGEQILLWFADIVDNSRVSERILGIAELIYGSGEAVGDVSARIDVYKISLKTFFEKFPFGIGPNYAYISGEGGLGYHSQFIDDIARYGIFAIAFYILFLTGYYRLLKSSWKGYEDEKVPLITTIIYFLFLVLNLGFRSGAESVIVLFIIPVIPRLFLKREEKYK